MSERPVGTQPGDLREAGLEQLRRDAELSGRVDRAGIRPRGAPFPQLPRASSETGYYGVPLLKAPAWTWEVPLYFFVGGVAGASAIVGSISRMTGAHPELVRDARALAAIGGTVSPALLIADLGMPSRFLHMLRVFKIQSPMSVGSWTLMVFSSSAAGLAFLDAVKRRNVTAGHDGHARIPPAVDIVGNAAEFVSVLSGAVLSTYTGVLIGATAVPVWNRNVAMLPIHFGASGMGSAVSILELKGHNTAALHALGMASALTETLVGASIEGRKDRALKPLKTGWSGWLTRIGGLFAGPVPLALRLLSLAVNGKRRRTLRTAAAISAVAGSVVTRFAWIQAGKASAGDARIPLELPEQTSDSEREAINR
jgi:formate-dependent nitrite reductase membrane component NrfD